MKSTLPEIHDLINIDYLWANKKMVHYFGLGFIQLKLNHNQRVHFYIEDLMRTVGEEEIHNHRYFFKSTVAYGQLRQKIYDVTKVDNNHTHLLTKETCSESKETLGLIPKIYPCNITHLFNQEIDANQSYIMDHNTFHTVDAGDTITILERPDYYSKAFADVVYPKDRGLVCPFSIKMSEEEIFQHISDLFNRLGVR